MVELGLAISARLVFEIVVTFVADQLSPGSPKPKLSPLLEPLLVPEP